MPTPAEIHQAHERVAEFVRQYKLNQQNDHSTVYNVWFDGDAEPAELTIPDLETLLEATREEF